METVFRKEIKYLISRREAMILQQKLDGIMERDIHGENGRYFIRSQYYDSIDDQDLWDNLDGMYEKRKIRLRIYSLNDLSAKLEFKCKNGFDGVKYSLPVSREQALRMEQGDASFLLEYETELAMRLYLRITQGCYRPKTIIDYQRLAFAYPAGDVRITFDTDMQFLPITDQILQDAICFLRLLQVLPPDKLPDTFHRQTIPQTGCPESIHLILLPDHIPIYF